MFSNLPEIAGALIADRPELAEPEFEEELSDAAKKLQAIIVYRRIPPKGRRASLKEFMRLNGYPADVTNPDDILELSAIAKELLQ